MACLKRWPPCCPPTRSRPPSEIARYWLAPNAIERLDARHERNRLAFLRLTRRAGSLFPQERRSRRSGNGAEHFRSHASPTRRGRRQRVGRCISSPAVSSDRHGSAMRMPLFELRYSVVAKAGRAAPHGNVAVLENELLHRSSGGKRPERIEALVNDHGSESLPDHCFGTAYHLIDNAGGAHQSLGLTDRFTSQQAHLFEVTCELWSWRKSAKSLHGKLLSIKTSLTNHRKLRTPKRPCKAADRHVVPIPARCGCATRELKHQGIPDRRLDGERYPRR